MIVGYIGHRNLPLFIKKDAVRLTHLQVAFASVRGTRIKTEHLDIFREDIARIKYESPELNIVLSIGGWGSGGFSEMAQTEAGRREFAQSAVEALKDFGFHGLDLDWEYPCIGQSGIVCSPDDKENYTALLTEMRSELDKLSDSRLTLSYAAGITEEHVRTVEIEKIEPLVDYISLMTYDMRGGFDYISGHHTNLYSDPRDPNPLSAQYAVELYSRAGIPKSKLLIGAAFYSRTWKDIDPAVNNGYLQKTENVGGFGPKISTIRKDYLDKDGCIRYWDDTAKAPYLLKDSVFITYDDEQSVKAKCEYVKENGLAGMMYWEHQCDEERILQTIIGEALL